MHKSYVEHTTYNEHSIAELVAWWGSNVLNYMVRQDYCTQCGCARYVTVAWWRSTKLLMLVMQTCKSALVPTAANLECPKKK